MTVTSKPRTIRINEYYSVLAPKCPECGKTDRIVAVDWEFIFRHFRCERCKRDLTWEETDRGQREVEQ